MQTSILLQEAGHGWTVVYEGFAYPFKTYDAALKLQNALYLMDSQVMPVKLANETWPSTPIRPFKGFNYAQQEESVLAQQSSPAPVPEKASPAPAPVVVESIDPRKIPLLAYVNAEFLPDAPKDGTDVSTKACWQRQARTIHGLLRDLEGSDKRNMHLSTELGISKSRVKELEGIVSRQSVTIQNQSGYISTLRDERDSYKGQVLKNTESIAVVRYSRRDLEWHLVLNGIAYLSRNTDTFGSLAAFANSINAGNSSISDFELIHKPYYKEDYA